MENRTDFFGNDIAGFFLDANDPQRCQAACDADSQCRAWTYTRPGFKGPQAACFLKTPVPDRRFDDCCISGLSSKELQNPTYGRLLGFEVRTGQSANIAAQSRATLTATCPAGKVALSAGYSLNGGFGSPEELGFELKRALPSWTDAVVTIKHGGVLLAPISVTAHVVCVNAGQVSASVALGSSSSTCRLGDTLLGGGGEGPVDGIIRSSVPQRSTRATLGVDQMHEGTWRTTFNVLPGFPSPYSTTAMCASGPIVAFGALFVRTPNEVVVAAQSVTSIPLMCPSGKSMVAAGFDGFGAGNDMTVSTAAPNPTGSGWTIRVANRGIGRALVRGFGVGICVDASP